MRKSSKFKIIALVLLGLFLTACGSKLPAVKPYKMDIQQGNVVTSKMLLQLRPSMTKSQVRYIMGTPLVVDSFHGNRWDYFYQMREAGKVTEKRRVILDFDKDLLTTVRGDVVAASDSKDQASVDASAKSVVSAPKAEESSWWNSLMFWKKEASPATGAAAVASSAAVKSTEQSTDKTVLEPLKEAMDAPVVAEGGVLPPPVMAVPQANVLSDVQTSPVVEPATGVSSEDVIPKIPEPQIEIDGAQVGKQAPVIAKPSAAVAPADDQMQAVQDAVNAWADAWRGKNVDAYLGAYADTFKPDGALSKKAWVAQRKTRLSDKQGAISLDLEDVTVQTAGNKATVQFLQKYSAKVYSDQVSKQLDLVLDTKTKRWLIVKESALTAAKKSSATKAVAPKVPAENILPDATKVAPDNASDNLDGVIEKIGF